MLGRFASFVAAFGLVMLVLSAFTLTANPEGSQGRILSVINIVIGLILTISGAAWHCINKRRK